LIALQHIYTYVISSNSYIITGFLIDKETQRHTQGSRETKWEAGRHRETGTQTDRESQGVLSSGQCRLSMFIQFSWFSGWPCWLPERVGDSNRLSWLYCCTNEYPQRQTFWIGQDM
jgi:hypothetical protein